MAIYHLSAKTISRGSKSSAVSKFNYISRQARYRKDKSEVLTCQSGNMPDWASKNPRLYWDAADQYERGNGRLLKQIEFALPVELNHKEQQLLTSAFVKYITTTQDGPLPYSYAIHRGQGRNPHCHLMISERPLDGYERTPESWFKRANKRCPESGGAAKTLLLRPQTWLLQVRAEWEKLTNIALKNAGYSVRIDCRSLKDQGINRIPTVHKGPSKSYLEKKGIITDWQKDEDYIKYLEECILDLKSEYQDIKDRINMDREKRKKENIKYIINPKPRG